MAQTVQEKVIQEVEKEVKLYLNKWLFEQGYITEQMFMTVEKELLRY